MFQARNQDHCIQFVFRALTHEIESISPMLSCGGRKGGEEILITDQCLMPFAALPGIERQPFPGFRREHGPEDWKVFENNPLGVFYNPSEMIPVATKKQGKQARHGHTANASTGRPAHLAAHPPPIGGPLFTTREHNPCQASTCPSRDGSSPI